MKYSLVLAPVLVAAVSGFAPASQQARVGTQLQESLFDKVAQMDLFAPKKDQNTYGARSKKDVSTTRLVLNLCSWKIPNIQKLTTILFLLLQTTTFPVIHIKRCR